MYSYTVLTPVAVTGVGEALANVIVIVGQILDAVACVTIVPGYCDRTKVNSE